MPRILLPRKSLLLQFLFSFASQSTCGYDTATFPLRKLTRRSAMHMHSLNWLAILVAAISTMVLGFLWYSPLLFAKAWTREMGYDPNDKSKMDEMRRNAGPAYAGSFAASLISAFTLALILHGMQAQSLHFGLMASFHIWLGF